MIVKKNLTAFQKGSRIAFGPVQDVLVEVKPIADKDGPETVLIFDDETGEQLDFNFRGTIDTVLQGLAVHPFFMPSPKKAKSRGKVGRPKLGVVSREVTLLPRHWTWLEKQPSGTSAALRRLVETAMKQTPEAEKNRERRDVAAKVMWTLAGDYPGFEEASRSLFKGEMKRFEALIKDWPADVQKYLMGLATGGLARS